MTDYSKITQSEEVITLLKEIDKIESRVRELDEKALEKYKEEKMSDSNSY